MTRCYITLENHKYLNADLFRLFTLEVIVANRTMRHASFLCIIVYIGSKMIGQEAQNCM